MGKSHAPGQMVVTMDNQEAGALLVARDFSVRANTCLKVAQSTPEMQYPGLRFAALESKSSLP